MKIIHVSTLPATLSPSLEPDHTWHFGFHILRLIWNWSVLFLSYNYCEIKSLAWKKVMYFLSYSKTIRPPWKSNELRRTTYWFKECVKPEAIFSWWVCRKSPPLDGGVTKATATNLAGQATIVASLLLLWRRWSHHRINYKKYSSTILNVLWRAHFDFATKSPTVDLLFL